MGIIKKIIHFFANIAYILIILYAIVCIPILFGKNPVVVLSGSMEPTYKIGSIIYYEKVQFKNIKVGDVITYEYDNKYISHRVNSIDNNLIETKGDANNTADVNKVKYNNIKGKVTKFSLPYIGYYIKFINDNVRIFMITLVVILLSEFLLSNIKTFDIDKNNERSEKNAEDKE